MAKTKQKKVLISGYIGFSNFGDDALLSVLINHLKDNKHSITALSSNPDLTRKEFGINAVKYKSIFDILKSILACDILISGGGNLFQNETSTRSLLYYAFIIFLAKFFFKKVVIYSQGIGPIDGFFPTFLTKNALKLADIITVRDVYSQRALAKWKIQSKFTYDAVWNFDIKEYKPENAIGIQLRHYNKLHKDFYKHLAKYVDMFFSDFEIRIFSLQNKEDANECYKLEKALKTRNMLLKTKVILYKDANQISNEFSKLNYLIAMRLHANILGLMYGIKTLPVSYSVKVKNLAEEFGVQFIEASKECSLHPVFTQLTSSEQNNAKIENAKKRKFEWAYIDSVINK